MHTDDFGFSRDTVFLNHGSFGAVPNIIRERQAEVSIAVDAHPDRFFRTTFSASLKNARASLARMVNTDDEAGLVFVDNATAGVQIALRSAVRHVGGDDTVIVLFPDTYGACSIGARFIADELVHLRCSVVQGLSLTTTDAQMVKCLDETIGECARKGTHVIVLLDHIVSATSRVQPLAAVSALCRENHWNAAHVTLVVDAAHAVGQIETPVKLCDFYVSNLHKWAFCPRGTAFLYTAEEYRSATYPLTISWGCSGGYLQRFAHLATQDLSRWVVVPDVEAWIASKGGFAAIRAASQGLRQRGAAHLVKQWNTREAFPDTNLGMALVALPPFACWAEEETLTSRHALSLFSVLNERFRIVCPVMLVDNALWVRVSCQIYNTFDDILALEHAITTLSTSSAPIPLKDEF